MTIQPQTSSRHPAKHITDLEFADDIALLADSLDNAQHLLLSLQEAAALVGLHLNEGKTEYISTSSSTDTTIISIDGSEIKTVTYFKYLGSWIMDSGKDYNTRKAQAWSACNKLDRIWHSKLSDNIKIRLFQTTIQPILLYGSETWSLSSKQQKRLDGTYTSLLRRAQNISWRQHKTLKEIYKGLPRISDVVCKRRVRVAGHCHRASNEAVSSLVLWKPRSTTSKKGRKLSYPDVISRDSCIEVQDLATAMSDRPFWKSVVESISAKAAG